jgi:hypothetical protein
LFSFLSVYICETILKIAGYQEEWGTVSCA